MKNIALFIALLIFTHESYSQNPCLPEGIYFTSQEQIDSFQVNYPGCTEIDGNVYIGGYYIWNLLGLNVITKIGGNLQVESVNNLTNLEGLNNLANISGNVWINNNNNNLLTLSGLENLISVEGNIEIAYNDSLKSLTGLEGLSHVEGSLWIVHNRSLKNLEGLDNLTYIGEGLLVGGVFVGEYSSLTSLSGMESLNHIDGYLWINHNDSLTHLSGLENLTTIGEELTIFDNYSLVNLTGLCSLTAIGGGLVIGSDNNGGNPMLTSLSGLENIEGSSIENLKIKNNSSLLTCNVKSVCDYLVAPNGVIEIHDNAPGCNSVEEVEEACLVGIEDNNESYTFKISPNPSISGIITIIVDNYDPDISLNFFNSYGQKVHQLGVNSSEILINTDTWQPGIYLIVALKNGKIISQKKLVKN